MSIRKMIIDLEKRGVSLAEMARQAKVHPPALSRIKGGGATDLLYTAGKRLEDFYNRTISANN